MHKTAVEQRSEYLERWIPGVTDSHPVWMRARHIEALDSLIAAAVESSHIACKAGLEVAIQCGDRQRARIAELESARNGLQDEWITWARCPKCAGLVAMSGVPCVVGHCEPCDHSVIESEMETVDPIAVVAQLRSQRAEADRIVMDMAEHLRLAIQAIESGESHGIGVYSQRFGKPFIDRLKKSEGQLRLLGDSR